MNYIVAIDMDGTLLDHNKEISEHNKKAILDAIANGHHVVIATGRNYLSAVDFLSKRGLYLPVIANNGASFFDGNKVVWKHVLPQADVKMILEEAEKIRSFTMISTINKVYLSSLKKSYATSSVNGIGNAEKNYYNKQLQLYNQLQNKSDIYEEFFDKTNFLLENHETLKVLISSYYEDDLENLDKIFSNYENLVITKSSKDNREFMVREASKGSAILQYRKHIKCIDMPIMVIGDHWNDQSMFSVADISVAMGNAPDEIKKMCNYVTKCNHENGVAYALQNYLI